MMNSIIEPTTRRYDIFSLLPYAENTVLLNRKQKIDLLYLIKKIIDLSLVSFDFFYKGILHKFDAQIGENLCQVRAYKILHLQNKWMNNDFVKQEFFRKTKEIKDYKQKIEDAVTTWEDNNKKTKYDNNCDKKETIKNFIERNQLSIQLNEDYMFIIICYFLTYFSIRDEGLPVAIDLELIAQKFNISKYKAKKIVHMYQLHASEIGCVFVLNIAEELPTVFEYPKILSKVYRIADEDRAVLPCYLVSHVIFSHCVQEKTFILFIVHQKKLKSVLYFLLLGKGKNSLSLFSHKNYLTQQCLVVSGEMLENNPDTSYLSISREILKKNPLRLILANTAAHPQYAGTRLQAFRDNPFILLSPEEKGYHEESLLEMQRFAIQEGCSKINPTVFYLKHIYASQVGREITWLHENNQSCIEVYSVLNEWEYKWEYENEEETHF
ncbi:hypothetical protein [Legionella maceachernii]|uniref:Uncharacterized protein n=1 Tax=Legionella maceachernii TaxID=466 RepID=A0A0W0VVC9_9GAMM|nr:hypothetical protein [Legionella maceachernii]KTD24075.1 hypothetical protein Lmac_2948 [Legionella maceachernii]SJZ85592.1 hypothetical protein SAMN02745128_01242 [Legionella maceachernii]SUO99214.1 Uncharacterised protein [Legionella maceachernii]